MTKINPKTTLFVGAAIGVLLATAGYALLLRNQADQPKTTGAGEPTVLKLAHGLKPDHPVHLGMEFMNEKLQTLSGGTLKLEIYHSSQLGGEKDVLEAVKGGNIAMTKVSAANLENYDPTMGAFTLPYIFHSRDHYWAFLDSPAGLALLDTTIPHKLRGLCYYDGGSRSIYINKKTSRAIRKPSDLKGLKIRVMGSKNMMDMISAFGGTGVPRPWGELYTDLQNGVVDGAENNLPSFVSAKHYEACSHFCRNDHLRIPDMLMVSEISWQRLSKQQRKWIIEAANASSQFQRDLWAKSANAALKTIKEAGVEVVTDLDLPAFRAKVKPLVDAARNRNPKIDAALKAIEALAPKAK